MFCVNCGKRIDADELFCVHCGCKQSVANFPSNPNDVVDNRFVWALATIPIFVSWITAASFDMSLSMKIAIFLNIIFLSLDVRALQKVQKNARSWLWLGFVLVPVYLFVRASKTDKNYGYGITWCVMFLIDLVIF